MNGLWHPIHSTFPPESGFSRPLSGGCLIQARLPGSAAPTLDGALVLFTDTWKAGICEIEFFIMNQFGIGWIWISSITIFLRVLAGYLSPQSPYCGKWIDLMMCGRADISIRPDATRTCWTGVGCARIRVKCADSAGIADIVDELEMYGAKHARLKPRFASDPTSLSRIRRWRR